MYYTHTHTHIFQYRRTTPKQQPHSLCITTSGFIELAREHPQQTSLSPATNTQCLFAARSSGMPLFELPMELDDHTEGNRDCDLLPDRKGGSRVAGTSTTTKADWNSPINSTSATEQKTLFKMNFTPSFFYSLQSK